MRDIFKKISELIESDYGIVLVTIAAASGSTPRGAGSQMLVGPEGLAAGTIGGGPGEGKALEMAARLLREKRSMLWTCALRHGGTLNSVCGGEQLVLFQYIPRDGGAWKALAAQVLERLEAHRPGTLELALDRDPVLRDETVSGCTWDGNRLCLPLAVEDRAVVFGGGHCALALVPILRTVGFRVAVYDDRRSFASRRRFPEAETVVCHAYTDIAGGLELTPADYAVVMTSGHSHDFEVEEQLLRRPLAYVGVMGSRAKAAYVNQRLREAGVSEEAIGRVHTPIGTAIKAVTPEEIAISIAGELIYERALRREAFGTAAHGCPSHL